MMQTSKKYAVETSLSATLEDVVQKESATRDK